MTLTIDRIGFAVTVLFIFYVIPAVRPYRTRTIFFFVIYARNSIPVYGVIYSTLQTDSNRTFKISQVITNVEYKEMISSHFSEKIHTQIYTKHLFSHHLKKTEK